MAIRRLWMDEQLAPRNHRDGNPAERIRRPRPPPASHGPASIISPAAGPARTLSVLSLSLSLHLPARSRGVLAHLPDPATRRCRRRALQKTRRRARRRDRERRGATAEPTSPDASTVFPLPHAPGRALWRGAAKDDGLGVSGVSGRRCRLRLRVRSRSRRSSRRAQIRRPRQPPAPTRADTRGQYVVHGHADRRGSTRWHMPGWLCC